MESHCVKWLQLSCRWIIAVPTSMIVVVTTSVIIVMTSIMAGLPNLMPWLVPCLSGVSRIIAPESTTNWPNQEKRLWCHHHCCLWVLGVVAPTSASYMIVTWWVHWALFTQRGVMIPHGSGTWRANSMVLGILELTDNGFAKKRMNSLQGEQGCLRRCWDYEQALNLQWGSG